MPAKAAAANSMLQDYSTYTDFEIERWSHMRAIEWSNWATFVSLLAVPVLLIFYPWYNVLIGLFCSVVAWQFIQHTFVNVRLSEISCLAVAWFQWPAALVGSIYLFMHGKIWVAVLALLWPLIGTFVVMPLGLALGYLGTQRSIGSIELALAKKLGYVSQDAEL